MDVATDEGFVAFYRTYARTSVHAVSTAALTAFGTLTIVHRGFAAVALVAYLAPPLAIYARESGTAADAGNEPAIDWTTERAPTGADLASVAVTADGAVAVGEDGTVLERTDGREPWSVALADGPGATGATLHDIGASDDGAAAWAVGDGGAVGRRDEAGRWVDYSAPDGDTNNLAAVAVAGAAGEEVVLVADGGGALRRGQYRAGEMVWDEPTTPGSGSSIAALTLEGGTGYAVDTAGDAFRTTDGGRSFLPLDLDAPGTPTAVAAATDGPAVATTEGVVHLHDGTRWTSERVVDGDLRSVASGPDGALVAVSGTAVHRRAAAGDWDRVAVPAVAALRAVTVGSDAAVAVGDEGALVERWVEPASESP